MRWVSWLKLAGCSVVLAACGSDATADKTTTTTDPAAAVTAGTRLVVVTSAEKAPLVTVDPLLVEDCVTYVPFASDQDNFYMHVIWVDMAHEDEATLRGICEQMGVDDPDGLRRISDEQKALDAFFQSFYTTTTGVGPPPSGTVPACPPGSQLNAEGFCVTTATTTTP